MSARRHLLRAKGLRSTVFGIRVEVVTQVITLLAYGCPLQAIVAAFGIDERTVASWQQRAGEHCQQVHQHLVQHPRDLGQVQADEIRVKYQGGIGWLWRWLSPLACGSLASLVSAEMVH